MTEGELKLAAAIYMFREAEWRSKEIVSEKDKLHFAKGVHRWWVDLFHDVYFPFNNDDVVRLYFSQRKNKATETKARIALRHNYFQCFWRNRGKGICSNDLEGGHIIPRAKGSGDLTVENGMIECRAHNNQRRARTIEEYLNSEETTDRIVIE